MGGAICPRLHTTCASAKLYLGLHTSLALLEVMRMGPEAVLNRMLMQACKEAVGGLLLLLLRLSLRLAP